MIHSPSEKERENARPKRGAPKAGPGERDAQIDREPLEELIEAATPNSVRLRLALFRLMTEDNPAYKEARR